MNRSKRRTFYPQAAAKKKEGGGKRAQRATSNVLGAFPQQQMQEFKEVGH